MVKLGTCERGPTLLQTFHCYQLREAVGLTNNRHTAKWSNKRSWCKSICSKVTKFTQPHEKDSIPPQSTGVVRLGALLGLACVSVLLQREQQLTVRYQQLSGIIQTVYIFFHLRATLTWMFSEILIRRLPHIAMIIPRTYI